MTGWLRRVDMGAGAWVLESKDGTRTQLIGDVDPALKGRFVRVIGKPARRFGFAMVGATLAVETIQLAGDDGV